MAGTLRRFLFQSAEGYYEEQSWTDRAKFELLTMNPIAPGDQVIDAGGGRVSGVAVTPLANNELASKQYVDSVAQGLDIKDAVEAVSTANIASLSGLPLIDGVYLYEGYRVLLTGQASGVENGIWVAHGTHASLALDDPGTNVTTVIEAILGGTGGNSITLATVADGTGAGSLTRSGNDFTFHYESAVTTAANFEAAVTALTGADKLIIVKTAGTGTFTDPADTFSATNLAGGTASAWTRPTDYAAGMDAHADFVLAIKGTLWKGSGWVCTSPVGTIVDTNATEWTQFSAAQNVTASHGLELVGNDLRAKAGDGLRLTPVTFEYIEVDLTTNGGLILSGTSPDKTLGVQANTSQGINVGASGVGITLGTDPGLEFSIDGLEAKVYASGGLQKDANGLSIKQNANDTGLTIDANGVLVDSAPAVVKKFTASGAILAARCVYISGNNVVSTASNSADATSRIIGVAPVGISDTQQGEIVMHGICQGVLGGTGVTNTPYYLGASGELVLAASVGAAKRMMCVGYAINANDLFVDIKDYGKKAA